MTRFLRVKQKLNKLWKKMICFIKKYPMLIAATSMRLHLIEASFSLIKINTEKPIVAVIMPVYNQLDYTRQALDTYSQSIDQSYNYILVVYDDHSTDGTKDFFLRSSFPMDQICYIRYRKNKGVTWAWNDGVRFALDKLKADYIFLVNNDVIFTRDCFYKMVDTLRRVCGAGLVGPLSNYPGSVLTQNIRTYCPEYIASPLQEDIILIDTYIAKNTAIEADYINGFCWGGTSEAFKKNIYSYFFIPYYFNPGHKLFGNEGEFEARIHKTKLKILIASNVFVFHYGGITTSAITQQYLFNDHYRNK